MLEQLEKNETAEFAKKFLGTPFLFNGTDPEKGFDNPGFAVFIVKNTLGIKLPHSANTQLNFGMDVKKDKLLPGDLVFFAINGGKTVNHVGIYLGDDVFIHAYSGTQMCVEESKLFSDSHWSKLYAGARRLKRQQ